MVTVLPSASTIVGKEREKWLFPIPACRRKPLKSNLIPLARNTRLATRLLFGWKKSPPAPLDNSQPRWEVSYVLDGGERVRCSTEREILEAIFSVEESKIVFKKGNFGHWVLIVLGNDGYDAIADYTYSNHPEDDFKKTMEVVNEYALHLETESY